VVFDRTCPKGTLEVRIRYGQNAPERQDWQSGTGVVSPRVLCHSDTSDKEGAKESRRSLKSRQIHCP
jgi:hypothetical protein